MPHTDSAEAAGAFFRAEPFSFWLFDFVPVRHFDNVVQKGDFFELRDYEARPVTVGAC